MSPGAKRTAAEHMIALTPPTAAWKRALPRASTIVRRAAVTAIAEGLARLPARHPLRRLKTPLEISIVLAGDATVRRLNHQFRGKDKPTNVLSFPAGPEALPLLGDVIIAFGVARREAASENKALGAHLTHLVMHGVLHLLGYDHHGQKDAATMERLETAMMAQLGLPDPYAEPVPSRR